MAKILFVTQKLTSNSLNQIEILRRSGHEFTVLTSQSEKHVTIAHHDVLYYFRRWNFIEMAKFFPSFMVINPDIVHIFVDSASAAKTADFFAGLAQLFRKILSIQFFLSEDSFLKIKYAKKLVYAADIVTGPHRTFLYHLRGLSAKSRNQIKGVIPPILKLSESSSASSTSSYESPSLNEADFQLYQMIVPLKPKKFDLDVLSNLAQRFSILFVADLSVWSAGELKKLNYSLTKSHAKPWRFFDMPSTSGLNTLPKHNFVLWIAGMNFDLEECIQYFEFCLNRKIKIVMDHSQMRLYPDLWDSNPMASITQKHHVLNFIKNFEYSNTPSNATDFLNTSSLVDISVNEFNRLISKATNNQNEKAV
ncbi:MAG: hypothetical protein JNL11_08740 [Bdellovibrionaceae bacterium]|nr:hypothetical protein [Pseudobdellovibrionaceae bacterium]